jgi:outer membrane protein
MKNLSLILNAVLIVAVGVLFYLHFSTKGSAKASPARSASMNLVQPDVPIVYVNIDTLLNNYDYFKDMQNDFADKQSEMEAELNNSSR